LVHSLQSVAAAVVVVAPTHNAEIQDRPEALVVVADAVGWVVTPASRLRMQTSVSVVPQLQDRATGAVTLRSLMALAAVVQVQQVRQARVVKQVEAGMVCR
jgi:hypothetical protein